MNTLLVRLRLCACGAVLASALSVGGAVPDVLWTITPERHWGMALGEDDVLYVHYGSGFGAYRNGVVEFSEERIERGQLAVFVDHHARSPAGMFMVEDTFYGLLLLSGDTHGTFDPVEKLTAQGIEATMIVHSPVIFPNGEFVVVITEWESAPMLVRLNQDGGVMASYTFPEGTLPFVSEASATADGRIEVSVQGRVSSTVSMQTSSRSGQRIRASMQSGG